MIGILVHGNNHFIVRGPLPDRATALALARRWTFIRIAQTTPDSLRPWSISTKESRENIEWAAVVPGDGEVTPAVAQLLNEVSARGIKVRYSHTEYW
jgi:hypothetical protein